MKFEIDYDGDFKELSSNNIEQTLLMSIVELLINKGGKYIVIISRDGWEILCPTAIGAENFPHFYRKNGVLFMHKRIIAEMGIKFRFIKKCLGQLFIEIET